MFERILIPLDGSEIAEMAVPYGEELGIRLGSELILYHVHGQEKQELEHMHQAYLDKVAQTIKQTVRKGEAKDIKIKVTTKVESGEPAESICNLVSKNNVDLILMAAVSASGLKIGKMLGSVTDHVCHTVPVPVMLIRPQDAQRTAKKQKLISDILIPLDGSILSKLGLPVGEELANKLKIPINLYQMAHFIHPYGGDSTPFADYQKLTEAEEEKVRAEMTGLERELKEQGFTATWDVTSGTDAADEIIKTSRLVDADLIIMSTHGRSGLGHWVLGSVAEKVLRYGEISLLLVNARAS